MNFVISVYFAFYSNPVTEIYDTFPYINQCITPCTWSVEYIAKFLTEYTANISISFVKT